MIIYGMLNVCSTYREIKKEPWHIHRGKIITLLWSKIRDRKKRKSPCLRHRQNVWRKKDVSKQHLDLGVLLLEDLTCTHITLFCCSRMSHHRLQSVRDRIQLNISNQRMRKTFTNKSQFGTSNRCSASRRSHYRSVSSLNLDAQRTR